MSKAFILLTVIGAAVAAKIYVYYESLKPHFNYVLHCNFESIPVLFCM